MSQARDGHLDTNMAVALRHGLAGILLDLLEIAPLNVCIDRRGKSTLSAQQLINGHVGPLAFDVPECHVHAAHCVEQHRAVAPVRANV